MPAVRSSRSSLQGMENQTLLNFTAKVTKVDSGSDLKTKDRNDNGDTLLKKQIAIDLALQSEDHVYFPLTETERSLYRTTDGKKLTAQQWAVYDLTREIPCRKVTTYKRLCEKLGAGSPRSVGSALRRNPFAPYVPCHRVVASDLSLGGFSGEWGTQNTQGSHCSRKVEMLEKEGVRFGRDGRVIDPERVLWK